MAEEQPPPALSGSEAVAESPFPGDTPAQSGAAMGVGRSDGSTTNRSVMANVSQEHCTTDRPAPSDEAPSGEVIQISEIECYVSKPQDYPHTSAKLLLLLSTGTGIHSKNNQIQADRFAAEGFLTVMPDMFNKDPCPNPPALEVEGPISPSTIEQIKVGFAQAIHATSKTFQIDMWLARQTPEKVMPILRKVIAGIKQEFADAVSHGSGIHAVGYCFGGKYVFLLGSNTADQRARHETEGESAAEGPLIKAGAAAHATSVTEEDLQNVSVPVCLVCVEDDPFFPDEVREKGTKHLEANGVVHEQKVYPGVPHGFAVVGDYKEEKIQTAQKEAYAQMLAWLQSH